MLTSSKSNWQNNQKIKHTNTGGANFSPSKSKYTPGKGLPLCKYFQASIGKHLTTRKKINNNHREPCREALTSNVRRQPADSVRRLRTRSTYNTRKPRMKYGILRIRGKIIFEEVMIPFKTYSRRTQCCVDKKKLW